MTRPAHIALLATVACSSAPAKLTPPVCTPACEAGLQCLAGRCQPIGCKSNADCTAPLTCIAGLCADTSCEPACPPAQACLSTVCVPLEPTPCGASDPCPSGESCVAGICTSTGCVPACASGDTCIEGVCVPPSTSCAPPYQACFTAGNPLCANLNRDPDNCGACGSACPATQVCNGMGSCATVCATGETACGGVCVDLSTSPTSCGACGQACAADQICSGGSCGTTCTAPLTTCGTGSAETCVDLQTDPDDCGSCGAACPVGRPCQGGVCGLPGCASPATLCAPDGGNAYCADLAADLANCGSCGQACPPYQVCQAGACGYAGCDGGQSLCAPDGGVPFCVDLTSDQANCGACGNACSDTCCGGSCVDETQDLGNCGGCGIVCDGGVLPPECMLGRCLRTIAVDAGPQSGGGQGALAAVGGLPYWMNDGVIYALGDGGDSLPVWDGGCGGTPVLVVTGGNLYTSCGGDLWQIPLDGGAAQSLTSLQGALTFTVGAEALFWVTPINGLDAWLLDGGGPLPLMDAGANWVEAGPHTVAWGTNGTSNLLSSATFSGGVFGPVTTLDIAPICGTGGGTLPYGMNDSYVFACLDVGSGGYFVYTAGAIPLDGGFETAFGYEGAGGGTLATAVDPAALTLYYAASSDGTVSSFDPVTGLPTLLVFGQATGEGFGIDSLAVDSTSIYFTNNTDGTLKQLTPK